MDITHGPAGHHVKLLFITRKYPPSVGGMERASYTLGQELSKQVPTSIISWGGSQLWLPWFLLRAFAVSLFRIARRGISHIHLGDGLLAPLGLVLKWLTGRRVSVTVHGLDVIYPNRLYQAVVIRCLKHLDRVVCISTATFAECRQRGIPDDKCVVIPWGISPYEFRMDATRGDLEAIVGANLNEKSVLVTVGRLVRRKGVYWFIEEVLPYLPPKYIYLVVGEGPERSRVELLIVARNLEDRVHLLGKVSDHDLKVIYNTADVLVMPNISVEGDIEGFGIVALEAASVGLPVVASRTEGIVDVIQDGKNGVFAGAGDFPGALAAALTLRKERVKESTCERFAWNHVADRYLRALNMTP